MSKTCDQCGNPSASLYRSPESDRQRRLILICSTCYKEVTGIGVTEIPPSRRLTFELVPKPLWGNNLSHRMTRSDWGKVRAQAITSQDGVCGICGGNQQPLECHERWEYEDEKHLQTLAGFIALCRKCHAIKHFGRQELLAKKKWQHLPPGEMRQRVHEELQPLVTHYLQVNQVPRAVFNVDYGRAMQLFARRSQFTGWTTDFGEYTPLVTLPPYKGYE